MKRIVCMSGVSGSGKSTYATKMVCDNEDGIATIASADQYFIGRDGEYRFDATKLHAAHAMCYERVADAIEIGVDLIVIDNTNTSIVRELRPYAELAAEHGYAFEVVTIECDVEKAAARNRHGTPLEVVRRQAERLKNSKLPAEWKHTVVVQ